MKGNAATRPDWQFYFLFLLFIFTQITAQEVHIIDKTQPWDSTAIKIAWKWSLNIENSSYLVTILRTLFIQKSVTT